MRVRPGRLEVHVQVCLPDYEGRQEILQIHSKRMRERGCLDEEAALALGSGCLAKVTDHYSGADLAGLLRSATSFALERYVDEALLQGWRPGGERLPAPADGADGRDGEDDGAALLEVKLFHVAASHRGSTLRCLVLPSWVHIALYHHPGCTDAAKARARMVVLTQHSSVEPAARRTLCVCVDATPHQTTPLLFRYSMQTWSGPSLKLDQPLSVASQPGYVQGHSGFA